MSPGPPSERVPGYVQWPSPSLSHGHFIGGGDKIKLIWWIGLRNDSVALFHVCAFNHVYTLNPKCCDTPYWNSFAFFGVQNSKFCFSLYVQLIGVDARNQELVQEMERVKSELERTKTESANLLKEEKKSNGTEMNRVRQELEKARKIMSKSEAHDELLKVQLVNNVSQILVWTYFIRIILAVTSWWQWKTKQISPTSTGGVCSSEAQVEEGAY